MVRFYLSFHHLQNKKYCHQTFHKSLYNLSKLLIKKANIVAIAAATTTASTTSTASLLLLLCTTTTIIYHHHYRHCHLNLRAHRSIISCCIGIIIIIIIISSSSSSNRSSRRNNCGHPISISGIQETKCCLSSHSPCSTTTTIVTCRQAKLSSSYSIQDINN